MDGIEISELVATPGPSTSFQATESDSNSDYSDETDSESDSKDFKHKDKPKRKLRRPASKINATLKGLMGEANLRYARGDIETAKKMCFEVMRQVPDAYEPYITLAQIFETSDVTKYEGYLAIASCLYPHDASIWCRLAELNIQNNEIKNAISCYTKAIRANPKKIHLHLKRLELVEKINDTRYALSCKRHMANKMPKSQSQSIIEICTEVCTAYNLEKQYAKALDVIQIPFQRFPDKITENLVNMKLELLIATERFAEVIDSFIQYCNFELEITIDQNKKMSVTSYKLPSVVSIDIKVKFIVCLIKLGSFRLIPDLIDSLIAEESVETIGDLFLDVAEDLMEVKLAHEALKLLIPLVKSKAFNLAAVWLKYAECLFECDLLEQAVEAYFTVMTMAPQHVEVLYPLAMTLLKLDKKTEALEVLSQDLSTNKLDVAVLIERMKLLKQIGDFDEYWRCAELLLSRHCVILKYPEEIRIVMSVSHTSKEKIGLIRERRAFRGDCQPIETNFECLQEPSDKNEFKVYRDILNFALERREYALLQKFAFMGLTSRKFSPYLKDVLTACFFACVYNNDTFHGYNIIRYFVAGDKDNIRTWNLFNVVLQNADDIRYCRFISRLHEKVPNIYCLQTIEAGYNLTTNSIVWALRFYMKEFRKERTPYFAFLLGVIFLQAYSKRKLWEDKKTFIDLVTYLFLYYAKNRSGDAQQEVFYNLGRMYQQLGVMYLAERYYLKVLGLEEPPNEKIVGLKHESAYNLHLIYKNSGNSTAARNILIKHLVI